ncbi:MAG: hypothetical protein R3C59_09995 [Planctomycetaceae bacterium]
MTPRKSGYIHDVDRLIEQTGVEQVLTHYGKPLPEKSSGEHRMQCVFNEACVDSQYGNLTVRLDDPINRIYCHSCQVRGNLLTLIHGLEHHRAPESGRLRGDEFKAAVATLKQIAGEPGSDPGNTESSRQTQSFNPMPKARPHAAVPTSTPLSFTPTPTNTPLHRHEKEAARALANLHEELITDVSEMSPEAAQYVRSRPWMTPELMQKWGVGWIPGNGRSLFRKNYLVYTHRNERGEVVSYSGRDLLFEQKWLKWLKDGKPEGKKPNKHRFVAGFHKGSEFYGGYSSRLKEPYVRESLQKYGIVVVEGMNDVIRLDELEVAAVALTSNRATDTQVQTLTRFAHQTSNNLITLLPDCDEEGESGFKDLLWRLAEHRTKTRLACSRTMFGGHFSEKQPEHFPENEWQTISQSLSPPDTA